MVIFDTEVIEVIDRAPGVKSFRFKPAQEMGFKPGQFFFVSLKIGPDERTKHFSFSNSPTEKGYIEFTKRLTDSDFSKALGNLKPGDRAKLKGPLGSFTFEGEYKRIAFLSGGIGITPLRSIAKFAVDKELTADITLLYGNNTEKDIIFKDDLDSISAKNKNFHVIYTLTAPGVDKSAWHGRTGYIDEAMIKEELPDYKERVFYICGPPNMVKALTDALRKLNISEEKIKTENFTGY